MTNKINGYLVLDTGEIFPGQWHGKKMIQQYSQEAGQADALNEQMNRAGEVVFNTSHSGYEEMATDPSYMKQIIVLTSSMQGNYGIDDQVWESKKIWIEGFVCVQIQNSANNQAWKNRLLEKNIPLLSDIDTRTLVLRLRNGGTTWGALVTAVDPAEALKKARALIEKSRPVEKDWVWLASRKEVEKRKGQKTDGPRLAVLDFGSKENILRELEKRSSELLIFPSRTLPADILRHKPDGLMLTNGPGDPEQVEVARETTRRLIGQIPIFGICMGHQVLALALGGKTYKMKFGHRGSNHPVRDTLLNEIYMTSQNHGYAVDEKSLPADVEITHRNLNDQTVAGFYSAEKKVLGIQYHPEACPGPHEAYGLFNFFIEEMVGFRK